MLGTYGLFEALDSTPGRQMAHVPHGQPFIVVRSYMAHHQGMLLVALGNFLNGRTMVDRFHSDARVKTGEMLLNEHAPEDAPAEWPTKDIPKISSVEPTVTPPAPWRVRRDRRSTSIRAQQWPPYELVDGLGRRRSPLGGARAHPLRARPPRDDDGSVSTS